MEKAKRHVCAKEGTHSVDGVSMEEIYEYSTCNVSMEKS